MYTNNRPNNAAGLPINHTAADIESGDHVMRRVECRPSSPLISRRPSISLEFKRPLSPSPSSINQPLKSPLSLLKLEGPLKVGPNTTSLIDDEDDLVDYFAPPAKRLKRTCNHNDDDCTLSRPGGLLWNVQEHQVPTLPTFFPLEQSSVFVPTLASTTLASRIVAVLKSRSIAASYDDSNAKVGCLSKAQVEFRIRMYRGRDEYQHGIIVEVQRLYGFDFSYIQDVYAILDAARESQTCHEESGTVAKSVSHIGIV